MKKTSIFATVTALAALVIYLVTSLTGFALIGCISFFAMDRVKLAADVWFIPVNRPETEDVALYASLAGVALYLISFVTVTVKAFSRKE